MATTNTIKIVFTDGEVLYISGVVNYRWKETSNLFVVEKNNYNLFFPGATVKYIGRKFDLEGTS